MEKPMAEKSAIGFRFDDKSQATAFVRGNSKSR